MSRAWSGLVMMFWPSMMSLEPPPVTPSRKFPPRLGAPAAPVAEPVLGVEELEPHAAANPPAAARPAAPMRSCRRETSVMLCPFYPPTLAVPPGRPAFLPVKVRAMSSRRRGSRHESAGEHEAYRTHGWVAAPEVRICAVKLLMPGLCWVASCGTHPQNAQL